MYNRTQVFIAACIGLFVFGMTLITLGSILPDLKASFGDEALKESTLAAILPIGILLGSLVFGPIVDRYGYKMLLIASVLISAVALATLAMARSVLILNISIFFIGFGGGIINGGTSALVSDISTKNKGAQLSLFGVFFSVGALGMPLLLGILSKTFSFRDILFGISVVLLLPVIYYFFLKFPEPKQPQGFPLKQGARLLKDGAILLAAFFLFFQSGVEALNNNWITSYLEFKLEISHEKSLYALSFALLGYAIARLLLGWLLKSISSFIIMIISLLLIIAGNLLMYFSNSYEIAFTALIITGFGLAAGFPVILGYVGQLYPKLTGTAFSICLVIALIGNTLINFIFGEISHKHTIIYQPIAMIMCAACMIVLMFGIKNKIGKQVKL